MFGQLIAKDHQDNDKVHQISIFSLCLIYLPSGFLRINCIQEAVLFQIGFLGGRDKGLFGLFHLF